MKLDNFNFRFFRNAIAGVLTSLNKAAKVVQVEKEEYKTYDVPMYYDFANDGQFMRDFFYQMPTWCDVPEHAEGMYERQPYGAITFDDFNVVQQEMTSRFARGNFDKLVVDDETGEKALLAFSAFLMSLPLRMTFTGIIKVDNMLQGFSILESLLEYFYKNRVNYFHYKGLRIPLMITFGDKGSATRKVPLTYKDNQQKEIPFTIEVETYFPVFDDQEEGSLRFRGHNIRDFYATSKAASTDEKMSTIKVIADDGKYNGFNDPDDSLNFKLFDFVGDKTEDFNWNMNFSSGKCFIISENYVKEYNTVVGVEYDGTNTIVTLKEAIHDGSKELYLVETNKE